MMFEGSLCSQEGCLDRQITEHDFSALRTKGRRLFSAVLLISVVYEGIRHLETLYDAV